MILASAGPGGPGFHVPEVTELFTFKPLFSFRLGPVDMQVTFVTVVLFAVTLGLSALFVAAFRRPKLVPSGLQNAMEAAVDAIRQNIVLPVIGPEGERFLPYLTTLFFFVLGMNLMEIVPVIQFPISSRMAYPALLAALSWLVFNVVGIRSLGLGRYLKANLFPPGVPKPIYVLLTPIEFFSTFVVRPITLAVRLFANMMAGHVMLTIFFLATGYFLYRADSLFLKVLTPFPFALSVVLIGFELFVGLIQAFIFTILTAVYIAGAMHEEH